MWFSARYTVLQFLLISLLLSIEYVNFVHLWSFVISKKTLLCPLELGMQCRLLNEILWQQNEIPNPEIHLIAAFPVQFCQLHFTSQVIFRCICILNRAWSDSSGIATELLHAGMCSCFFFLFTVNFIYQIGCKKTHKP